MFLKRNKLETQVLDWKTILNNHYGKLFFIQLCSRFLAKKDWKPKNGESLSSCFLLTVYWIVFVAQSFWKKTIWRIFEMNEISVNPNKAALFKCSL